MPEEAGPSGTIEEAYEEALSRFGYLREVTGIDIGPKYRKGEKTGAMSIRIHVTKKHAKEKVKPDELFPSTINGFPVDVLERNYVPTSAAPQPAKNDKRVD